MIEFDFSKAAQREYFTETAEGIQILDLVHGTPLQPGQLPPSFADDVFLGPGIKQLQRMAAEKRLTVQLILSYHGSAEQFADIVNQYGSILSEAPMIAIETDWFDTAAQETLPGPTDVECFLDTAPGRRAFQEAELAWLAANNKPALLVEHATGARSELSIAFNYLIKLFSEASERKDSRSSEILVATYQVSRHWAIPAQLGYWLHKLEEAGKLSDKPIKIPLILGSWHARTEHKLIDYFGIPTEICQVIHRPDEKLDTNYNASGKAFMDIMSTGKITNEQLETLLEKGKQLP